MTLEFRFDNRFVAELPGDPDTRTFPRPVHGACWSPVTPTPVAAPRLLAHSREVASELGLSAEDVRSPEFAAVFAGNSLVPGMKPYAACYGGHQFGNWAGQLGDGRAITLGETFSARDGGRLELQLKGAGRTPYSRNADGRAVLRSSIREFLCSEAMHHLGVPTTRALCVVATGDQVIRDMFYDGNPRPEQGAVVCRVAPSFVRFGNFEIFAVRRDRALLGRLVEFTISRDFPGFDPKDHARWFEEVCVRTARMIVEWMRVGFVHGVMNTDNMSVLGLTLDYGPYGWIDNYDPDWTPNTTDAMGRRYRFGAQPEIAHWNLARFGEAIFETPEAIEAGLEKYVDTFNAANQEMMARKFGFASWQDGDEVLMREVLAMMRAGEVDMTLFFRALAEPAASFEPCFYRPELYAQLEPKLAAWMERYRARVGNDHDTRKKAMNAVNPKYVLRNYLAQEAIDLAEQGDTSRIETLLEVLRRPYDEQPEHARFAEKRPDWARHKAGCSMLSCSS